MHKCVKIRTSMKYCSISYRYILLTKIKYDIYTKNSFHYEHKSMKAPLKLKTFIFDMKRANYTVNESKIFNMK